MIGALEKNVMRQDVVVTIGRDNWDDEIVGRIVIVIVRASKNLSKLANDEFVQLDDLVVVPRMFLVVVVTGRVAGPDDEIDFIADVVTNPVEGGVDQRQRGVAARRLGAVVARCAVATVAGAVLGGAAIGLVEGVGVEVCETESACDAISRAGCVPVMWRNLPVRGRDWDDGVRSRCAAGTLSALADEAISAEARAQRTMMAEEGRRTGKQPGGCGALYISLLFVAGASATEKHNLASARGTSLFTTRA